MALTLPVLADREYEKLLGEVLGRIAVYNPEWTDFNRSDAGIALVELFAFLVETLLWQLDDQERRRRRRRRLAVLIIGTAGTGLVVWRASKDSDA
jgi:hypothetical protein